jgi:hypothetical protein
MNENFEIFTAFSCFFLDVFIRFNKDRQCTYNVTSGHVRTTIVAVEKQQVLHILSVCL